MLVSVIRPPAFADWHFLKSGSCPGQRLKDGGAVLPDHYISKEWLLGLEGYKTVERLGEHLHLKEAEKEFTIAFYSHAGCKKRKQMSKQDKHTKNHGN